MSRLAMATAVLTLAAGVLPACADEITLRIGGIHNDADATAVSDALGRVPGIKVTTRPMRDKPDAVLALDPAKADIGRLARAVAGVKTLRRAKDPPSATLVLRYERLDGNALADEVFLPKRVEEACGRLKGVLAKECKLDSKNKHILLRLDGKGGAKLADIRKGFPGLMVR
jgi:hypothetical protein